MEKFDNEKLNLNLDNLDLVNIRDINNKQFKNKIFSNSIMRPPIVLAKELSEQGFDVLNVFTEPHEYTDKNGNIKTTKAKVPTLIYSTGDKQYGFTDWQNRDLTNIPQFRQGLGYGLRTGLQRNGRKICSFDFDINGATDEKGKETEKLYLEYIKINPIKDGAFSGGTTGNKNILIDYTDSERFCNVVDGIGGKGSKAEIYGFEIFVGNSNQQVIPPTATPCKIHKCLNTRSWENGNAFMVLNEEENPQLIDWCVDIIQKAIDKSGTKPAVKKEKTATTITPYVSDEEDTTVELDTKDKYYQLLFNVIQNIGDGTPRVDREDWLKICGALQSNNYPKAMWIKWSKSWTADDIRHTQAEITWDNFKRNSRPVSIHTLNKIARVVDEPKYKEWCKRYEYFITPEDFNDQYKLAEIIKEKLNEKLVMHFRDKEKVWYEYNETTHMWGKSPNITEPMLKEIRLYIDYGVILYADKLKTEINEEKKEVWRKLGDTYNAYYKTTNNPKWVAFMKSLLESKLASTTFQNTLDQNIGKLVFKNGVFDLETGKFRKGIRYDDFVTRTIDMDYKMEYTAEEMMEKKKRRAFVDLKFKQVCNNNNEHFVYYTTWIGFSLIGKPHQEKGSVFLLDKTGGNGDNGKSIAFESLSKIAGQYIHQSSKGFLEEKQANKAHKRLAEMKKARIVYIDEFSKETLNAELFKEISNGVSVENEIMFGTTEKIDIRFKPFILTNNDPKWKSEDGGAIGNRYNQMSFRSSFKKDGVFDEKFLKFERDTTLLTTLITTHSQEFLEMFMDGAKRYTDGYKIKSSYLWDLTPASFLADAEETKSKNNPFAGWANKHLLYSENPKDRLSVQFLMDKSGLTKDDVKTGMKSVFSMEYKPDLGGNGEFGINMYGKNIRGGYKNIKMNEDIVEDE